MPVTGSGGGILQYISSTDSVATTNFLARVASNGITLDGTHHDAYKALLDGLTTDGLFSAVNGTSAYLDLLYIFCTNAATGTATTLALMNLVQNTFNGTASGSPTFTADQGYTGTDGGTSTAMFINTGMNASTAGGKYTQNACHLAAWYNTLGLSSATGGCALGVTSSTPCLSQVSARYSDGNSYGFLQWNSGGGQSEPFFADDGSLPDGHYVANRSGASADSIYKHAVDRNDAIDTATTMANFNFYVLANNNAGTASSNDGRQISAIHIGGSLTGTQITALNTRIGAFRTTMGL